VAVPTTYAGSEATPVLGETEDGVKTTRRDPALAPGTVVYDPELTLSMPRGLTLTSALNALAHAVEALWDTTASAATRAYGVEAADGILTALPVVLDQLADVAARARLQEAAWLAGACLAQARMGLHHQLAHALGGTFGLPHAELHALLLAHVMRFNLGAAPDAAARLARVAHGWGCTTSSRTRSAASGAWRASRTATRCARCRSSPPCTTVRRRSVPSACPAPRCARWPNGWPATPTRTRDP
jgi:alcohol dehydrogenase class IV